MLWKPNIDMTLMSLLFDVQQADQSILNNASVCSHLVKQVGNTVDAMNCYYSNLIEGVHTKITDIDQTLNNSVRTENYELAMAHIAVNRRFSLLNDKENIYRVDFIKNIHKDFYSHIGEEHRTVKYPDGYSTVINGGAFRSFPVSVGEHNAPSYTKIDSLMSGFSEHYGNEDKNLPRFLNALSSHHRLAWIHPFPDGNGRTARLHTQAGIMQAGIGKNRLWSLSRGLAVHVDDYYRLLHEADNLTESSLYRFVTFLAEISKDQAHFMASKIDIPQMKSAYILLAKELGMPKDFEKLIDFLLVAGDLERNSLPNLLGKSDRSARDFVHKMSEIGLLSTNSLRGGVVNLGLTPLIASIVLPDMFPFKETIAAKQHLDNLVAPLCHNSCRVS
jgi:Fic family protein